MCRGEGLASNFGDPITELVVMQRDEASLLAVEGVADGKFRPTPVIMVRQVRWLYAIAQEEGFPALMIP